MSPPFQKPSQKAPERSRTYLLAGALVLQLVSPQSLPATGAVSICDEAHLRSAMVGGGTVTFACDGMIPLADTLKVTNDTILDASGYSVILSGNNLVRVFTVPAGVSLTLSNLTVANGRTSGTNGNPGIDGGPGLGGGAWVAGALNTTGCRFWTNVAVGGTGGPYFSDAVHQIEGIGDGGDALGGAIELDGGILNANDSDFVGNYVSGGAGGSYPYIGTLLGNGGKAFGGAVYNYGGTVNLEGCRFLLNEARGGLGSQNFFEAAGTSGAACGGVLYNTGATSVVANCRFELNSGSCPRSYAPFSAGGAVSGGAIHNSSGLVSLTGSAFVTNTVSGGAGGLHGFPAGPGRGGAVFSADALAATSCSFFGNAALGGSSGGAGQDGLGGALYNGGSAILVNSYFSDNYVAAGRSSQNGSVVPQQGLAKGGAVYNGSNFVAQGNTFSSNFAQGAAGGLSAGAFSFPYPGSNAFGGGLYNAGLCLATNNTFAHNKAFGGAIPFARGEPPSPALSGGSGYGGGLFNDGGTVSLTYNTFAWNSAEGGSGAPVGGAFGGAIGVTNGSVTLIGCILANSPSGSNAFGSLIDAGHNLCSDASGNFSGPGSLNNVDPQLGRLDDYGGPTPTLPLLTGSPAIDAGESASCPATDQRGRPRPYGPACDIGAFESSPPYLVRGGVSGFTLAEEIDISAGVGAANVMSSNRRYSLEGLPPATYQVTPVSSNYLFVPPSRMITVGPDQLNMDFRAYRWNALSMDGFSNGVLHLVYAGTNGQTIRLLASTNLIDWSAIATNTIGPSNLVDLFVPEVPSFPARFYATMRP